MKKLWIIVFIHTFVFLISINAADEDVSTLSNEAQVQKAENLSVASQEKAQKSAQADVTTAEKNLQDAQDAYDKEETPENLAALNEAQTTLDKATSDLSNISGVSQEEIEGMRTSGMGWGEIAHELGVHPGVLGLGHTKDKSRERNSKSFSDNTNRSSDKEAKGVGLTGKTTSSGKSDTAGNNSNSGKGNNSGNGKK